MKVILLKDTKDLGKAGDLVEAKDGYARNFLFPRKIAIEANDENMKKWEEEQARLREVERQNIEDANALADKLKSLKVKIEAKGGESGRLFGAITSKDIAEALKAQHGIDIDRRKIELKENIKNRGAYYVPVKLYTEISGVIKVEVVGV